MIWCKSESIYTGGNPMRSRKNEYVVTKEEVHGIANDWLASSLKLEYQGRKCSGHVVLQILLIAAARVVSVFAACRDLADAPTSVTIFNALDASLPEIQELERRLNLSRVPCSENRECWRSTSPCFPILGNLRKTRRKSTGANRRRGRPVFMPMRPPW